MDSTIGPEMVATTRRIVFLLQRNGLTEEKDIRCDRCSVTSTLLMGEGESESILLREISRLKIDVHNVRQACDHAKISTAHAHSSASPFLNTPSPWRSRLHFQLQWAADA